jgi:hypothetical protein
MTTADAGLRGSGLRTPATEADGWATLTRRSPAGDARNQYDAARSCRKMG